MKKLIFLLIFCLAILTGCGEKDKVKDTDSSRLNEKYKITKVELPHSLYTKPALLDDFLYIPVNINSDFINTIIRYDPKKKTTDFIFKSQLPQPVINGLVGNKKWLVWVESDISGKNSTIYVHNRKTGKRDIISRVNNPEVVKVDSSYLYNDYLAWVDINSGKPEVTLYNLETGTRQKIGVINNFSLYNTFLNINENKLLWTDTKNGVGFYYLYDIKTGTMKSYNADLPFPGYAKLMDDKIFSINFNDYHNWVDQQFGYFDLNTQTRTILDRNYINRLEVGNSRVAVINAKQELEIIVVEKTGKLKRDTMTGILNTHIDSVDFSSNGVLIAGYTDIQKKTVVLFLIKPNY